MREILKQSSWLVLANVLTRIVSFFYTIFLARVLGVSDFGQLSVAISYFAIISAVSDFGFNRYIVREVARDKLKSSELLCNVVMLRLTLTSVVFGIFSLGLYLMDPDKMRVSLSLLATLAILPQGVALTFDGIFIGIRKLKFSAISVVLANLAATLAGLYLVINGLGATGAVNAIIFGQIIYVLILYFFLHRLRIFSLSKVTFSILKKALVGSLPYGLLGILGLLYFRIDSVLLSYMKGSFETGLYGVSYRFLEAIIFIPGAFASALFPILTKLHDKNTNQMRKIYFDSLKLMITVGFGFSLVFIFILPFIFKLFLPDYLQSVDAIKILALSIPFIFAATPGVQVLLSTEKYLKVVIWLSVFTVALNIVLNLIFIPSYGIFAAAWITVLSDIVSFVIFFSFIRMKILK